MVGHPVENDAETESVSLCHEIVEILECTELRVCFTIVLYGVVRTERTLAAVHSDRIDRHEPYDVHSEFSKAWKFLLCCCECALRSVLTHVHFIYHRILERLLHLRLGA